MKLPSRAPSPDEKRDWEPPHLKLMLQDYDREIARREQVAHDAKIGRLTTVVTALTGVNVVVVILQLALAWFQ